METKNDSIPTIRSAHEFKEILVKHFRAGFAAALKEAGVELKGPKDVETRHVIKGALRAVVEIVADAGWGWSYANGDAQGAVSNVYGHRSKSVAHTAYATAGCAPSALDAAAEEGEDEEDEEGDEDEETEEPE